MVWPWYAYQGAEIDSTCGAVAHHAYHRVRSVVVSAHRITLLGVLPLGRVIIRAMATSIEEITKEIVDLPRHQRLTLVRLLLDLDRPGTGEEIDAAWDEEIRARVKAVDDGRVIGISYEQIKKEMAERFRRR